MSINQSVVYSITYSGDGHLITQAIFHRSTLQKINSKIRRENRRIWESGVPVQIRRLFRQTFFSITPIFHGVFAEFLDISADFFLHFFQLHRFFMTYSPSFQTSQQTFFPLFSNIPIFHGIFAEFFLTSTRFLAFLPGFSIFSPGFFAHLMSF